MSEQKPLMEKSTSDVAITQNFDLITTASFPFFSSLYLPLFPLLTFTMVDETDSLKTRLEKDLIIDVGKGNDLVAVTESQATELSNECSRSSSVYSVKDKTASMKSNSSIEKGLNAPLPDDATLPPFKESERHPKQAWWRGRSSDMNVDPKTFSNRKKISITAVIALAASM